MNTIGEKQFSDRDLESIAKEIGFNNSEKLKKALGKWDKAMYTKIKQLGNKGKDGKTATERITTAVDEGNEYDIILLDLRMPIMNGYDVIRFITSMGWKIPTIIVVTASVLQERA